jgi:ABC-type uncharacterized transport system YnjBCD ATPase subunit
MGDGSEVVALDHATLTLGSDEIVALVGPSGLGQDDAVLDRRRHPVTATEGTIVVGGEDISDHDAKQLTKFRQDKVGFVFQSVNLVPFLNARENLSSSTSSASRTGAPARERADQLLEELGLADRAKNLPSQLSGGQRQRVAIGRALMNDPAAGVVRRADLGARHQARRAGDGADPQRDEVPWHRSDRGDPRRADHALLRPQRPHHRRPPRRLAQLSFRDPGLAKGPSMSFRTRPEKAAGNLPDPTRKGRWVRRAVAWCVDPGRERHHVRPCLQRSGPSGPPAEVRRLRGGRRYRPRCPLRRDLRLPRPERRRQVDDGEDAVHAARHHVRLGDRRAASTWTHSPTTSVCGSASRLQDSSIDGKQTGREMLHLQGRLYGLNQEGHHTAHGRRDRSRRHRRRDRQPRGVVLRGHETASRPRDVTDSPTTGAVPRRANDRARPCEPIIGVGRGPVG